MKTCSRIERWSSHVVRAEIVGVPRYEGHLVLEDVRAVAETHEKTLILMISPEKQKFIPQRVDI